ncbi:MAG: tripartite tricarboxylate transporter substrate binding protein [Betaproteobacteria bacterium]|nr:tripartite tricarboxylate transporter substrate binding protein [Betaproteobacteria bacterium]
MKPIPQRRPHADSFHLKDFLRTRSGVALALLLVCSTVNIQAQNFPAKAVSIIVPALPGGIADLGMRRVAQKASEELKQPVVVQNRSGGGGGAVSAVEVKNATPDGYTLFMGSASTHAVNKSLISNLPYDATADFRPVSLLYSIPTILTVPAKSPARNVAELVAMAKSRPGGLFYLSPGIGTASHLAGEMIRLATGLKFEHIAHKGVPQALTDLAGERGDLFFTSLIAAQPFIRDGRLRVLGITSPKRSNELPDVPTMAEAGYPSVEIEFWFCLVAPQKTPDAVIRRLNDAFAKSLASPEVIQALNAAGVTPSSSTPEALAALIVSDTARFAKIVKEAGIKPD